MSTETSETLLIMEAMSFEYVVEGILLFIVGLVGIVANTVALVIFMEKRTHIFYRWECIFNSIW